MFQGFLPIIIFFAVALFFGAAQLIASRLLGPHRPNSDKLSPYECGIIPTGDARRRFSVQFYLIAMLFVLFDIEGIFFWPWAAVFRQLVQQDRLFALGEMGVFIGILVVGFVYLLKSKAFEWE